MCLRRTWDDRIFIGPKRLLGVVATRMKNYVQWDQGFNSTKYFEYFGWEKLSQKAAEYHNVPLSTTNYYSSKPNLTNIDTYIYYNISWNFRMHLPIHFFSKRGTLYFLLYETSKLQGKYSYNIYCSRSIGRSSRRDRSFWESFPSPFCKQNIRWGTTTQETRLYYMHPHGLKRGNS